MPEKDHKAPEGRRHARAKIPLLISYWIGATPEVKYSMLTDLSVEGARFTTETEVPVGMHVKVLLKLPWQDEPLQLLGEAKRSIVIEGSAFFQVALIFSNITDQNRTEISKVVHMLQGEQNLQSLLL